MKATESKATAMERRGKGKAFGEGTLVPDCQASCPKSHHVSAGVIG